MADNYWVKVNTPNGPEYVRAAKIDLIRNVKFGKFDLFTSDGTLLATVKGDPDAFLDDLYPEPKPPGELGFRQA